jgi:predicted MPP superfamily phosphohydrolase
LSLLRAGGALAVGALAWGLYESQWVACRTVDVPVRPLPPELDGLRILHLSDFHLGMPSLNRRALDKAVRWASGLEHDLVAITGDLVSHPRGEEALQDAVGRLSARAPTVVALGNHDVAATRDPFSAAREIEDLAAAGATLLRDEAVDLQIRGQHLQVVGADPRTFARRRSRPWRLVDPAADLRLLLCHFPDVVRSLPREAFQLVLAGHLHGGQICVPTPRGKIRLSQRWPRYPEGTFRLGQTTLVVSRGLGTTFVPFRFFARPEAAQLVLRAS